MMKKHLVLLALLVLTLTLLLSGCGKSGQSLEGKYIATFELNGGTLDLKSFDVTTKINYAYDPGAHILDPATYGNYEISRAGYRFTGWYTSPDCKESEKWNFKTDTINSEALTLYAGWVKEIVYTFTVCYADGGNTVELGTYNVSEGAKFDDYRDHAKKRDGYTATGYYQDAECTTLWDANAVHPGGATDTDIKVYVKYIEGNWKLVDSFEKLKSAIGQSNIYLTADIDCGGAELDFRGFNHILNGNGHTVSNFTVKKTGTVRVKCSIFDTLGSAVEIKDVSFANVTYDLKNISTSLSGSNIKVGALAVEANGCKITNVSVTGKLITNYEGALPSLSEAFCEGGDTATVTDFTAEITVEKQS